MFWNRAIHQQLQPTQEPESEEDIDEEEEDEGEAESPKVIGSIDAMPVPMEPLRGLTIDKVRQVTSMGHVGSHSKYRCAMALWQARVMGARIQSVMHQRTRHLQQANASLQKTD